MLKKAMEVFEQGIENGASLCWGNLAQCYQELQHYDNVDKCWVRFIENAEDWNEINTASRLMFFIKYMNSSQRQIRKNQLKSFRNTSTFKNHEILESIYNELTKNNPERRN